jgi:hypothetical protein
MKHKAFCATSGWVLFSLLLLTSAASAQPLIGTYHFDEMANWSWSGGGSGLGTPLPAGGVAYPVGVVGYPFEQIVIGQTFGFCEPGLPWSLDNLSDVIHFDDAWHFSYYSDVAIPPETGELADLINGSLASFVAGSGWTIPPENQLFEIGPEGNNHVAFTTMVRDVGIVEYVGISDIPEPSTVVLFAIGGVGLLAYVWCRRRA